MKSIYLKLVLLLSGVFFVSACHGMKGGGGY